MRTQDMVDTVPKKAPVKPFIPHKGKETKPFLKPWIGTGTGWMRRLEKELGMKKRCFSCKEPWESGQPMYGQRESTLHRGAF
jgi:hypothetical protein